MIKFKKIPIEAIEWSDKKLHSIITDNNNIHDRPHNLTATDECYIQVDFLQGNLRSKLHKAFLFLTPKYRIINGYPHSICDLTDKIISMYD